VFGTEECAGRMNTWAAVFPSEGGGVFGPACSGRAGVFGTEECAGRMNTWAAAFPSEG